MCDVYLSGYTDSEWRDKFKNQIAQDITIFDPINLQYSSFDHMDKANQVAKELENIDACRVVVFYLCSDWKSYYNMIQIGDAIGQGKQVIVFIEDEIASKEKIMRYCEYRGVLIVNTFDDLINNVEECLAQIELVYSIPDTE